VPSVVIDNKKYHYSAGVPQIDFNQAILFVHGAGGSHRHWIYQVAGLGQKYLTLAVDLPGHGESEGNACNEIDDYSSFIYDFAERVLGAPFYLAGHSMGGAIALRFATRFPEMLKGLILIGTGARLRVAPAILNAFAAGQTFTEFVHLAYCSNAEAELLNQAKQEMANTDPEIYYNDFLACDRFDIMDRLQAIKAPALVVGAAEDRLTPPKYSTFLADNISNARLHIIARAGHMMMLENPTETNQLIEEFIEE